MLALGADPGRMRQHVAERLGSFPGLDRPKDLDGWHVTLGYLQTPTPFATDAERADFQVGWAELETSMLGVVAVDRVWLVHYADRTLSRIVGKAPLLLGRPNISRLTVSWPPWASHSSSQSLSPLRAGGPR